MNIKMLEQVSYDEKENFDFFVKPVMIRMFSTIAARYWHNSWIELQIGCCGISMGKWFDGIYLPNVMPHFCEEKVEIINVFFSFL